ncbi:MAG TPA: hypothetical protein VFA11_17050 [Acidimicrobiales bacterium]|nr:hypothetical protein [Acidimicrobiales bacterium]
MIIETHRFRLASGTSRDSFVDADSQAQVDFFYQQAGLRRRTVASGDDGEWLTVTLWDSPDAARAAWRAAEENPAARHFLSLIDDDSTERKTYSLLG